MCIEHVGPRYPSLSEVLTVALVVFQHGPNSVPLPTPSPLHYREKVLSKVDAPAAVRSLQVLRGKANTIASDSAKFVKAPAAIDFDAYRSKLKFTSAAVKDLETVYANKSIPQYSAKLPAFEAKKRAAMLAVVKSTVDATKADLEGLQASLAAFEAGRITDDTSLHALQNRFPSVATEVETEIKEHQWAKDSL